MEKINQYKQQLRELLKIHYGFSNFRNGQEEAIDSILHGKDTVVVMPTGGGKSLIFQLPSLVLDGVTIVISPLIALMKDQVDSLNKIGIPATFINSSLANDELEYRLSEIAQNAYRLIYIAPERFYNQQFVASLRGIKVALFAIDEAHCISQWGHDFRPSYLRLKAAIDFVGRPPVVALTATATREVRADIIRQLELPDPTLIVTGFARPNLQLAVISANDRQKIDLIVDILKSAEHGSGIVYVGTRNKVDEIVEALNNNDVKAIVYHAGIDNESRSWVQNSFMNGEAQVVVATNAFGLGIDKRDVRFVIHHDLPGTLEAYYQEAGRAGRDGQPSFCLLLHSPRDRYLREFFIKGDNPSPNMILDVYDFLLNNRNTQPDGSLLLTYSDISKHLADDAPEMAVGTALKILEREGYITRPNEKTTNAWLKAKADLAELTATVGSRSKVQLNALNKIYEKFHDKIATGWQVNLEDLASIINVKKDSIIRLIKKLVEKDLLEYKPPFRGTEIKLLKRVKTQDVEIDFRELREKLRRAYEKLDEMEGYAYNLGCRQNYILKYFGDDELEDCGRCDSCLKGRTELKKKTYLAEY